MVQQSVSVLDCTLRDGLRIVDCEFEDPKIVNLTKGLIKAGIDIVELGFLRDWRKQEYKGNSTFFTDVNQIGNLLSNNIDKNGVLFSAFIDYGMFDFNSLEKRTTTSIDIIRFGFTKKDFKSFKEDIISCMKQIKEKDYLLFLQGVNTPGYSDEEFLELIDIANSVRPYAFALVDTYGAMYDDDVSHYYELITRNLDPEIALDFHSHNNYQLSFSLAQRIIKLCNDRRLIVDSSLNGVGKVAGNLNTELLTNYLNRKKGSDYDEDIIMDLIDEYIYPLRNENIWGYSIPALLAGQLKSHPNNIIYLTKKFRLNTKDIKYILSMIDEDKRQRYDYANIEKLYIEYNSSSESDNYAFDILKSDLCGKSILLIGPGDSINSQRETVKNYIDRVSPIIISINFYPSFVLPKYVFFGSKKRYLEFEQTRKENLSNCIISSNIRSDNQSDCIISYSSIIECGLQNFDGSFIMAMNLMKKIGVSRIAIAGIDGFKTSGKNYCDDYLDYKRGTEHFDNQNKETAAFLRTYKKRVEEKIEVSFITDSLYCDIFSS